MQVGLVSHIEFGHMFLYKFELIINGLNTEQVRDICMGETDHDVQVATCIVSKYPLHNFVDGDNFYHYGGQGGDIAKAHKQHVRVLQDQEMIEENEALHQCMDSRTQYVS